MTVAEDGNDPSTNQNEDEVDDYYMFGVEHDDFDVDLLSDEEAQPRELPAIENHVKTEDEGLIFYQELVWLENFFLWTEFTLWIADTKEPKEDNIAGIYKVLDIKNTKKGIDPSYVSYLNFYLI